MKTKFLVFIGLLTTIVSSNAQIAKNTSAIVYYMPKTELVADVEYEKCDAKVGMFYQYSQRYLGTDNAVRENKTTYKIKSISFKVRTVADMSRAYTLVPSKNSAGISLTEQGIICGINTTYSTPQSESCSQLAEPTHTTTPLMPLGEEQMMAGSIAKMAESTAKQIYHIRESRLNLLAGDVDNMPTESQAIQLILDNLREQEDALTSLFIGTQTTTIQHAYYTINPTESGNSILFRFSQILGPVDADDLSGAPIFITTTTNKMQYDKSAKENKTIANAIYYNIPGEATIEIKQGNQLLAQTTQPIPQLGISVPIEPSWLNRKIYINPITGMISHVE